MGRSILRQLQDLACAVSTSATTRHQSSEKANKLKADSPKSVGNGTSRTGVDSEGCFVYGKAAEFYPGYGANVLNPQGRESLGLEITPDAKQCLVSAVQKMMGGIVSDLEQFLGNVSDVVVTTPFVDTTVYEESSEQCWCFLVSLLGLWSICVDCKHSSGDGTVLERVIGIVEDKFGCSRGHNNALIMSIVSEIKRL